MNHSTSPMAIGVFLLFVLVTLGLSSYLGRQAKSSAGYFAAHGQIPWFVNGIAFAGDYLSAASFLGICGMIAFYGYDGFLYSIGYLAGWIVALLVIAEPMKRLGKFTFADALNARFNSRGIKVAAGISTLAVSIFYLIPQMVGAGVLVQPLLGFPHWVGVVLVGAVVIFIVVTAGMVSTTWVQFIKGSLLVAFSTLLTVLILARGFEVAPDTTSLEPPQVKIGRDGGRQFRLIIWGPDADFDANLRNEHGLTDFTPIGGFKYEDGRSRYWSLHEAATGTTGIWRLDSVPNRPDYFWECQFVTKAPDGRTIINGREKGKDDAAKLESVGLITRLPGDVPATGPLNPISFFSTLEQSTLLLWGSEKIVHDGSATTVYYPREVQGSEVLRPGASPTFAGIRSGKLFDKLNFLSLMLALFCGTASLPHILIRYYTVKDEAAARKSTIVGIACIGFFYVLTLYMGLGAMTSGALDPADSNMAAPLLARSFSELLFAVISALAFTTVLGTVSGLILASAGAVTHDLLESIEWVEFSDHQRVRVAKFASVVVGVVAIVLGILFREFNVSYLVGWAFSVAASANLPALLMLLFWRRTTYQGVIAAIVVGMVSSLAWILLSGDTFASVYGLPKESALAPFSQPGIVTIPLGFATLIVVSLLTNGRQRAELA